MATGPNRFRSVLASLLLAGSLGIALPVGASLPAAAEDQAPAQPAGRQKILDELFDRLAKAQDDSEAKGIAGAIDRVWMRSGSDTADLLMNRAVQAISRKNWALSQELLDKIVVIDPYWAEAWNKRATARFFAEDYIGSMADLAQVLTLEPRHYAALTGMGFILQRTGFHKRALQVFRRALELNPQQEEIKKMVEKLVLEVEGQPI
jgi:tetratricopeptide (TPR) repeat protein